MPLEILNQALYHDRTMQDWHRLTLAADCWAIDIDLMGACNRCRGPLYLIEASTRRDKPATILKALAKRAGIPAFLVLHSQGEIHSTFELYPRRTPIGNAEQFRDHLLEIRKLHKEDCAAT